MLTLLIDGDILAYQIATTAEQAIDWGDDFWTLHADAALARANLDDYVKALKDKLEADAVVIALTDGHNFRKDVLPTYKANRKSVRKPVILPEMRAHLEAIYKTFIRPGLEGDDILGILATSKQIVRGEKIIVSIDKDMKTIPGDLYNAKKADEGVVLVTQVEADRFHMMQTLMGDVTDGYTGCPGIGPKKAEAILADAMTVGDPEAERHAMWAAVVHTYAKAGLSEEVALQQARVARILRASDYDFKRKQPKLWSPPL